MKKIPLGIDDYKTIKKDCYYVDKTNFISSLLKNPTGSVLLFTRPRRFGKTLTLSMVETFFDNKENNALQYFDDTNIMNDKEALKEMGKYPVVFLSFKDCHASTNDELLSYIKEQIVQEYKNHSELLNTINNEYYLNVTSGRLSYLEMSSSIFLLTEMLHDYFNKEVILLIDEYDTPIQSSYDNEFYSESISYIKHLYGTALKGNKYLRFALCSGVTRIAKESIFSGINNLIVNSVLDNEYGEYFGFTTDEVKSMLKYYGHEEKYEMLKEYYDGYNFGNYKVFNPWSTLYCIRNDYSFKNYWANTSSNFYIMSLMKNNSYIIESINKLLNDEKITTRLEDNFTYGDEDVINIFSLFVSAGYLTYTASQINGYYLVYFPNLEIKELFSYISFSLTDRGNMDDLLKLKNAFMTNNADEIETYLNKNLLNTLSYYDYSNEKEYQMMILTLSALLFKEMRVKSEVNSGLGRCDIMITSKQKDFASIIELKQINSKVSSTNLIKYANSALNQIEKKQYFKDLLNDEYEKIVIYGIAFYKNNSKVVSKIIK